MKRIIRISEGDIRKIVNRSIKRVLNESNGIGWGRDTCDMLDRLKELFYGQEGKLVDRICGKVDEMRLKEILKELIAEYSNNDED